MIAAEPILLPPVVLVIDVDDDNTSSSCHSEGEVGGPSGASLSGSEPNQEKDSGIECSAEFCPPDEETASKIRRAVEYYLSDANILKDSFLLKHVRRSKEGYVSLKLISSFRKLRSLCRNWKTVAHSVQNSEMLVLNSDWTKVRRVDPLPDYDETTPSRTVLVYSVQDSKISVESINEAFAKCGEIALVRIQRSGNSVPIDLKRFVLKNPEIQNLSYGLVEFEEYSGAKKAVALGQDKQIKFKVLPLLNHDKNTLTTSEKEQTTPRKESPKKKKKRSLTSSKLSLAVEDSETDFSFKKDHRQRSSRSYNYWSSGSSGYLSSSPGENYDTRRHSHNPGGSYPEYDSRSFSSSKDRNQRNSKEQLNKKTVKNSPDLSLSPWRRRREQMLRTESSPSSSYTPVTLSITNPLPVATIRQPRGPDGSKGFQNRSKAKLPSTAE